MLTKNSQTKELGSNYFWFPGNTSIDSNGIFRGGDSDLLSKGQTREQSGEPEVERQRLTDEVNSTEMENQRWDRLEMRQKG